MSFLRCLAASATILLSIGAHFSSAAVESKSVGVIDNGVARTLASDCAPILRFHAYEQDAPTVAWFAFFAGVAQCSDNTASTWVSKIRPVLPGHDDLTSLDSLRAWNSGWPGRLPIVFYSVDVLNDMHGRQIADYLRSDRQALRRWSGGALRDDKGYSWTQVRYYCLYLNDSGLKGHPHDIEFVTVFVPMQAGKRCGWVVQVGHGHTDRTPNNVLVRNWGEGSLVNLVEYGDHSNAPAMHEGTERLATGIDVNWHLEDVWGIRDTQAASGSGYNGNFEEWMCQNHPDSMELAPRTDCDGRDASDARVRYDLVPLEALKAIQREDGSVVEYTAFWRGVREFCRYLRNGAQFDSGLDWLDAHEEVKQAAYEAAQGWGRDFCLADGPGRVSTIDHRHFEIFSHESVKRASPKEILKTDLFLPTRPSVFRYGLVWGAGRIGASVYWVVPAISTAIVPIALPGVWETSVEFYERSYWGARMTWKPRFNHFVTGYWTIGVGMFSDSRVILAGGVSCLPFGQAGRSDYTKPGGLEVRLGLRMESPARPGRSDFLVFRRGFVEGGISYPFK